MPCSYSNKTMGLCMFDVKINFATQVEFRQTNFVDVLSRKFNKIIVKVSLRVSINFQHSETVGFLKRLCFKYTWLPFECVKWVCLVLQSSNCLKKLYYTTLKIRYFKNG